MNKNPSVTLGWRLRVRMSENRITTATELKRRLDAVGYDITSAQLSRILDDRPTQVKTALLEALLNVLGGSMDDLMPIQGVAEMPDTKPAPDESPREPSLGHKRHRKPPRSAEPQTDADEAGGPRIHPFPTPRNPSSKH